MNNSVNPFLDKRYPNKEDSKQFLIELSVYLKGKQFRISMGLYATQNDFDKVIGSKSVPEPLKELRKTINGNLAKAQGLLDGVPNIDADKFKRLYKMDGNMFQNGKTDLFALFKEREDEFFKEGRHNTYLNARGAGRSFKAFKKSVFIEDIDEKWLKDYKIFMEQKGNSNTTASMYLKELRAVFNKARKDGVITEKHYPFKYFPIGTSVKSKNVLYGPQLKAFWEYEPIGIREMRAKNLFFFCYLCNGMNMKDAVYLRWKNIRGESLSFVREKTKRTNKVSGKEIKVYVSKEVLDILDKIAVKDGKPDDFVFPIITNQLDANAKEVRRKRFGKTHNKILKNIGKKLGFDVDLCFNLARHSFATMLKLNGTPVSFISEFMGHSNGAVTENYLKSLPSDKIKSVSESLLKW